MDPMPLPVEVVYPPRDPGLPAIDPLLMVQGSKPRIDRLQQLVVSDRDAWEVAYLAPIQKLARIVHLLPASSSDLYPAPAGLFNLCLDVAYFSLQSADGKIFTPDGSVEERHKNEPRWRYATFLAALSCQVYRSLSSLTVVNEHGAEWPRFTTGLAQWLESTKTSRYFINWHESGDDRGSEGAAILSQIAPGARMDWLALGDVQIVRDMHQVALGTFHESNSIMARVVKTIVDRVAAVDVETRRSRYGRLTVGMHVEPVILDIMRELAQAKWRLNTKGSPLWWGTDGLWLEWPAANADFQAMANSRGTTGLPRTALTISEILGNAGAVVRHEEHGFVQPMMVLDSDGEVVRRSGLRFGQPECLLGLMSCEPIDRPVGAEMYEAAQKASTAIQSSTAVASPLGATTPTATNEATPKPATAKLETAAVTNADSHPPEVDGSVAYASLISPQAKAVIRDAAMAELFGQLIHHKRVNRGDIVKAVPNGLAFCNDWIAENSATGVAPIFTLCRRNQWLGSPKGKPAITEELHEVQFDDKKKLALVLNKSAVAMIGFDAELKVAP